MLNAFRQGTLVCLGIVMISGCSKSAPDAKVVAAQNLSQAVATSNAKVHLARYYKSQYSALKCEADDDIDADNLKGDGDADCQFINGANQKKVKLECATVLGQGCRQDH